MIPWQLTRGGHGRVLSHRGSQFVLTLAQPTAHWRGNDTARNLSGSKTTFMFFRMLACQPRLLTLSYIFQSIKRCWKCWLSSRWQVCTEQKARLEKLKIQLFVFPTIWSFCVRDSIFSFLCWLCHLLPLFQQIGIHTLKEHVKFQKS